MENQSDKWIIYPETKVVCFHNPEEENGFLSNWYVSRFEVDGKMFSSMEQFMMYQKAICFHDEAVAEKILKTDDVACIKELGRMVSGYNENIWNEEVFLEAIYKFKEEHNNYLTLLISSNESYAAFISKNSIKLKNDGFIFNYPSIDIMETLIMKEKFYKTYHDSVIKLPKTYYVDCSSSITLPKKITYPIILKPSNVIMYNHLSFEGKKKIYQIKSKAELTKAITKIVESGYNDYLIIQDYIPGDDSYLFDAVAYVNSNHQVELLTLAQIGLQEHTSSMVGNAAVLINGYNQYTTSDEIVRQMKTFLEDINYQGFCEFDLKYDYRDNTFKVLEINARQGRCSYYLSMLGYNLVKILIDDLIYHQRNDFKFLEDKVLLSFVPKGIVKKYITNQAYQKEVLRLWKKDIK